VLGGVGPDGAEGPLGRRVGLGRPGEAQRPGHERGAGGRDRDREGLLAHLLLLQEYSQVSEGGSPVARYGLTRVLQLRALPVGPAADGGGRGKFCGGGGPARAATIGVTGAAGTAGGAGRIEAAGVTGAPPAAPPPGGG